MKQTEEQSKAHRRFSREFKVEAVELCHGYGRPVSQVARELGVSPSALRKWVSQSEIDSGQRVGISSEEQAEIRNLRRQLRVVMEERDILKRAVAFFARETR
jgi:transposase